MNRVSTAVNLVREKLATLDPDANVRVTAAQEPGTVLDNSRSPWLAAWQADTRLMYRRSLLASAMSQDVVLPAAELDEPDSRVNRGRFRPRGSGPGARVAEGR